MTTPFDTRVDILAELYREHDYYPELKDFFTYHDLALPYVLGVKSGFLTLTPKGEEVVNDSWYNLLTIINKPDEGFADLYELFPVDTN